MLTSAIFSLIFVGIMCVFALGPMKFVTFSSEKNDDLPKRVVDFLRERDTFRNTIMEIVKDFDEKSYNNNGKPWKSSRILRVKPMFHFLHFSIFSLNISSFFLNFSLFSFFISFVSCFSFFFLYFSFFSFCFFLHFS